MPYKGGVLVKVVQRANRGAQRAPAGGGMWAVADIRRMTATQMGLAFGISRQAFSGWRGDVPKNEDGTWSLPDVIAWKLRKAQDEVEIAAAEGGDSPALEEWRKWRAAKAELEFEQLSGRLVRKADVEARWGRVLSHIVQALDGLGKMLAPRLARREEREIAETVRDEVRQRIDAAREMMLADEEI